MKKGLLSIDFEQGLTHDNIFFKGARIFMVYIDGGIPMGPSRTVIEAYIKGIEKKFTSQMKEI